MGEEMIRQDVLDAFWSRLEGTVFIPLGDAIDQVEFEVNTGHPEINDAEASFCVKIAEQYVTRIARESGWQGTCKAIYRQGNDKVLWDWLVSGIVYRSAAASR